MSTFAWDIARRHRTFLDGPDWLAGETVEHVGPASLGDLGNGLDRAAIHLDVHQVWRGGYVVIPKAVMHSLEMPESFTRLGV